MSTRSISVGPYEALGLADAKPRQFAVADAPLDQLFAVWCIGSPVIGCIECRLIVVKVYGSAFFGHRTTVICLGSRDWRTGNEKGEMKLYTYYRSQASFRVRIALNLKGIAREGFPVTRAEDAAKFWHMAACGHA